MNHLVHTLDIDSIEIEAVSVVRLPGSVGPVRDWVGRRGVAACPQSPLPVVNEGVAESEEAVHRSLSTQAQYSPEVLEIALLLKRRVQNRNKMKHKILQPALF